MIQLHKKEAIAACSNINTIFCTSEQMRTAYEDKSEHFGVLVSERAPRFQKAFGMEEHVEI